MVRPAACLLAVMAACAMVAGVFGWLLATSGAMFLVGPIARELPADRHAPLLANLWAHSASYGVGLVGSVVISRRVCRSCGRPAADRDAEQGAVPDALPVTGALEPAPGR